MKLRVKELAEERGYNMSRLQRQADVAFNTIKRIWRDPHASVNTDTLEKIARVLGVTVKDLFEDE